MEAPVCSGVCVRARAPVHVCVFVCVHLHSFWHIKGSMNKNVLSLSGFVVICCRKKKDSLFKQKGDPEQLRSLSECASHSSCV